MFVKERIEEMSPSVFFKFAVDPTNASLVVGQVRTCSARLRGRVRLNVCITHCRIMHLNVIRPPLTGILQGEEVRLIIRKDILSLRMQQVRCQLNRSLPSQTVIMCLSQLAKPILETYEHFDVKSPGDKAGI